MTTRATVGDVRVTLWQTNLRPSLWMWMADGGVPQGPFRGIEDAITDAQYVHGPAVRIVRHSEGQKP